MSTGHHACRQDSVSAANWFKQDNAAGRDSTNDHQASRQRGGDGVFARNDRGKYDAPAPTVRRAEDDLDGIHHILGDHLEDVPQTQREIIADEFFEGWKGANIAERRGISANTSDTHRKAAFRTRRDSITTVPDFSTEIDHPD
jgi:DNA-directed RNA polymerase specialized sigma24 family protein